MPLKYPWFKCTKCGHEFEEVVEKGEKEVECEECGEKAVLLNDFSKQVHTDGMKYRHGSWNVMF